MQSGTIEHSKKPNEDEPKVTKDEQGLHRSGVGLLLYLVKFSRPDISNAVRELSKVMDRCTPAHMKNLLRVIKFVRDTEHVVLHFDVRGKERSYWVLKAFSDSDWA